MFKRIFVFFSVAFLAILLAPAVASAATSVVANHLSTTYTYPYQFDVLVGDFNINLDSNDFLQTFIVQNVGAARSSQDIKSVHLWTDGGAAGFQGLGVDNDLGAGIVENNFWIWKNLNLDVYSGTNRFFVTIETVDQRLTTETRIQFQIPVFYDANHDFLYETGDSGLFFNSHLSLPVDTITSDQLTLKTSDIDTYGPKIVLIGNTNFTTNNFLLGGVFRDQGKTGMDFIKIAVVPAGNKVTSWQNATLIPDTNNWMYGVSGLTVGYYDVYVQGADTAGNTTELSPVRIFVDVNLVSETPITTSTPTPLTDGSLIKGSDMKVYVISAGKKRWITTGEVFEGLGYKWEKIQTISDTELANYPNGDNISTTYRHPDGTLIKYQNSPVVYILENGQRRPIANEAAFLGHGYHWDDIITIPTWEIYTDGSEIAS